MYSCVFVRLLGRRHLRNARKRSYFDELVCLVCLCFSVAPHFSPPVYPYTRGNCGVSYNMWFVFVAGVGGWARDGGTACTRSARFRFTCLSSISSSSSSKGWGEGRSRTPRRAPWILPRYDTCAIIMLRFWDFCCGGRLVLLASVVCGLRT